MLKLFNGNYDVYIKRIDQEKYVFVGTIKREATKMSLKRLARRITKWIKKS